MTVLVFGYVNVTPHLETVSSQCLYHLDLQRGNVDLGKVLQSLFTQLSKLVIV